MTDVSVSDDVIVEGINKLPIEEKEEGQPNPEADSEKAAVCHEDTPDAVTAAYSMDSSLGDGEVKFADLPLLPLMTIGRYLVSKDRGQMQYQDLFNYRNSCSSFNDAVVQLMRSGANQPVVAVSIGFEDDADFLTLSACWRGARHAVLLHPLHARRDTYGVPYHIIKERSRRLVSLRRTTINFAIRCDVTDEGVSEEMAKSLLGPIHLDLDFNGIIEGDVPLYASLVKHATAASTLEVSGTVLSTELGAFILALVKQQTRAKPTLRFGFNAWSLADPGDFVIYLATLTTELDIYVDDVAAGDGMSNVEWLAALSELRDHGYKTYVIDETGQDAEYWDEAVEWLNGDCVLGEIIIRKE